MRAARAEAAAFGADLVMFSELFLAGYPPEDLVLKPAFEEACRAACEAIAPTPATAARPFSLACRGAENGHCYNAYCPARQGRIEAVRFKVDLPNYGVFDEKRVFTPGPLPGPVVFQAACASACRSARTSGARIRSNVSAETGGGNSACCPMARLIGAVRHDERLSGRRRARVSRAGCRWSISISSAARTNLSSMALPLSLNADCSLALQLPAFARNGGEDGLAAPNEGWCLRRCARVPTIEEGDEADYAACVLGLRDYVKKMVSPVSSWDFRAASIWRSAPRWRSMRSGLAGSIALMLPYRFTSLTRSGRSALRRALGIRYDILPIAAGDRRFRNGLGPILQRAPTRGITEENIQSRARGIVLMSVSNKFGPMLVTTGNKSEMSVGYATIYGDMNGGFNPIKDLYKTQVFRLCELRNAGNRRARSAPTAPVIPRNIIAKPPTAELRENQKDQDSLPPYDALDDIWNVWSKRKCALPTLCARDTIRKR